MIAGLDEVVVRTAQARLLGPVTWTLRRGQRWVIAGPNGAGKSTLLRLVGGWEFPSAGHAEILGERVGASDLRAVRARIGWVSGHLDRSLASGSTVLDVLVAGLHGHLRRWRTPSTVAGERRAAGLLELVGCGRLTSRLYSTLSDGERQRVLLGRALMPDPPLLLLDEPFAGLDLAGRELLIDTLDEVARARPERVVVLVTHHLEDVPGSITHGLLLRDGLVEAQGPLDDVLTDERVSACFGIRVRILKDNGRYTTVAPKTA